MDGQIHTTFLPIVYLVPKYFMLCTIKKHETQEYTTTFLTKAGTFLKRDNRQSPLLMMGVPFCY